MLEIRTFGCRLNFFESEIIRKMLKNLPEAQNWIVFNSCSITKEAYRQLKQSVRKVARENEDKKIIITGCSAQIYFEELSKMAEVFKVIDNKNKLNLSAYLSDKNCVASAFEATEIQPLPCEKQVPEKFEFHTKAFIQIQQGCNNFCTYCIVPFTRGRSISFDKKLIYLQVEKFLKAGYKELTLTGVDIASYDDNGQDLADLIADILKDFDGDYRIRLSSIDPAYKGFGRILKLMKDDKRLTPFLHLSIQSCDDKVLRAMNRKHTTSDLKKLFNMFRSELPNIAFGADFIFGFPAEGEVEFENSYNLIKELAIEHLHVFPYSERPKTASLNLKDAVAQSEKKERVRKILALNNEILKKRMDKMLGETHEILSEGKWGYTDNYFKVLIDDESSKGQIISKVLKENKNQEYFSARRTASV